MLRDGLKASVLPGDDALQALEKHLAKLYASIDDARDADGKPKYNRQDKEAFMRELGGFQKLFASFVPQRGRVIDWNKISPPPEGMITAYNDLQVCCCIYLFTLLYLIIITIIPCSPVLNLRLPTS